MIQANTILESMHNTRRRASIRFLGSCREYGYLRRNCERVVSHFNIFGLVDDGHVLHSGQEPSEWARVGTMVKHSALSS